jgi:peptide/nickel transport system ATP-binding protein
MTTPLLEVENLEVSFHTDQGTVRAVDGLSFTIDEGEAFGLVGESGAGKSVASLSLLRLIQSPPGEIESGSIRFQGEDILQMDDEDLRQLRGNDIAMIFQNAETALNPSHTVGHQIAETVQIHQNKEKKVAWERAVEMLEAVGIPDPAERAEEYPHQFSGGMQQRAMIAVALANNPALIIADEPTTALDVTIEASILNLISNLQEKSDMSILFVSHDLNVISEVCDSIGVMYAGNIVERGSIQQVYRSPRHPYTHGLLNSILTAHEPVEQLTPITGRMPTGTDRPPGCRFHPRCPAAMEKCTETPPKLRSQDARDVACHLYPSPPEEPGSAAEVDDREALEALYHD